MVQKASQMRSWTHFGWILFIEDAHGRCTAAPWIIEARLQREYITNFSTSVRFTFVTTYSTSDVKESRRPQIELPREC